MPGEPFLGGVTQHNAVVGSSRGVGPVSSTTSSGTVARLLKTQSLAGKMENAWVPFAGLVISFELDKREWTGAKITLTLAALI